ncbi:MAG: hypothetical protein IT279_05965 [Ignavibacteriaceae bacterium]|nr:hypothetical protein [Ignavibacteriaceae bacterium]
MVHKFCFLLIFFTSISFTQRFSDPAVDKVFKEGITLALNGEYDEARLLLENQQFKNSKFPFYEILSAASEIGFAYDYALPANNKKIHTFLDEAAQKLKKVPSEPDNQVWINYCSGLINGYRAILYAYNSEWMSFINAGLDAVSFYEKCIEIDPQFGDAFASIGAFKFWRSEKLSFLNWMPFVSDEREFGRSMLEKARRVETYHTYFIYKNLFDIYYLKEDYSKARDVLNEATTKYPNARMFQYDLARYLGREKPLEAIKILQQILTSYDPAKVKNRINELRIKGRMVNLYNKAGQKDKAKSLADEILSVKGLSEYEQTKLEKSIERVKEIREELK